MTGYGGTFTSTNSLGIASEQQQSQKEVELDDSESGNIKDGGNTKNLDLSSRYEHHTLSWLLFLLHCGASFLAAFLIFHFKFSDIVFFHDPLLAFEKCGAGTP